MSAVFPAGYSCTYSCTECNLMKFDFGATNGLTGELRLQGKKWHTLGLAHEKTGPLHVSAQ